MTRPTYEDLKSSAAAILEQANSLESTVEALAQQPLLSSCAPSLLAFGGDELESEVKDLATQLDQVFRVEPVPPDVCCLQVFLFAFVDGADDVTELAWHLRGQPDVRPDDFDWCLEPVYTVRKHWLQSAFLNRILRSAEAQLDEECREHLWIAYLLPSAGLLLRAALRKLGRSYIVAVTTDDADGCPYLLR